MTELYRLFLEHPSVQTDTRKLQTGDIFFALKGDNFNGNRFAKQAIAAGASYAVIDEQEFAIEGKTIVVPDVLEALQSLATEHRDTFNIPFLAITGSNGKTTTKELIDAVLSKKYNTLATKGNFNNHIGVPLTLLSIPKHCSFAIIEMGANHQKEIEAYCQWAKPTFGLINNCGKAHLEGFGGIEGVRKGKGELYDYIAQHKGIIFRNSTLDYLESMGTAIEEQILYGSDKDIVSGELQASDNFLKAKISIAQKEYLVQTQLVGDYNLSNVLAAISIGYYFKVAIEDILAAIEDYSPNNNRSQKIVKNEVSIILDAYNANPSSMQLALASFRQRNIENKTIMLGAMKELGNESDAEHRQLVQLALQDNWKHIILVGEEFKQIAETQDLVHYFDTSNDAKQWYKNNIKAGDEVYIKGSRLAAMENIIED